MPRRRQSLGPIPEPPIESVERVISTYPERRMWIVQISAASGETHTYYYFGNHADVEKNAAYEAGAVNGTYTVRERK